MLAHPPRGPDVLDTDMVAGTTSVIIVTYNSASTIARCLQSVIETSDAQVLVSDNDSADNTCAIVSRIAAEHPDRVQLIENGNNLGFSEGCNVGLRNAHGEYLVLLNPDTEVFAGWDAGLRAAIDIDTHRVGAAGPISDWAGSMQSIGLWWQPEKPRLIHEVAAVLRRAYGQAVAPSRLLIGFCMMLRRDALAEIGGLDPELFLGNDDLDLSWRLRTAGWDLVVAPSVVVGHEGQVSFKQAGEAITAPLVEQSTKTLLHKLESAYGTEQVPDPVRLFGVEWFAEDLDVVWATPAPVITPPDIVTADWRDVSAFEIVILAKGLVGRWINRLLLPKTLVDLSGTLAGPNVMHLDADSIPDATRDFSATVSHWPRVTVFVPIGVGTAGQEAFGSVVSSATKSLQDNLDNTNPIRVVLTQRR